MGGPGWDYCGREQFGAVAGEFEGFGKGAVAGGGGAGVG